MVTIWLRLCIDANSATLPKERHSVSPIALWLLNTVGGTRRTRCLLRPIPRCHSATHSGRAKDGELIFMSERHSGEPKLFIDRPNPIDPGFAGKLCLQFFLTRSRHVRYEIGRLKHFLKGRC